MVKVIEHCKSLVEDLRDALDEIADQDDFTHMLNELGLTESVLNRLSVGQFEELKKAIGEALCK
jgi:hypothetical protein